MKNYDLSGSFNITKSSDINLAYNEKTSINFIDVEKVLTLNKLNIDLDGVLNTRNIEVKLEIVISDNKNKTSGILDLSLDTELNIELNPFFNYDIIIYIERVGSNQQGNIRIKNITLEGTWENNQEEGYPVFVEDETIISTNEIFKVFNLEGYELVSRNDQSAEYFYRISQDNSRTWSEWTRLTESNLKNQKIDPIRFFQIQYKIQGSAIIGDINLVGEFINVTENYQKTNTIGIRENCSNGLIGNLGITGSTGNSFSKCNKDKVNLSWSDGCDMDKLFKPYNLKESIDLYDKFSNQVSNIFGWNVEYFKVAPDENGIDRTIHEYTLYNVNQTEDVKILVPQNQFPQNQVAFNQWDMNLFESFEIQITKREFKNKFGADKRPSKEDFLYICELSRMYIVDHAQAIRDFANASVYYKLILKKYNQKADVRSNEDNISRRINELTKNTTLEDLFGKDKKDDKEKVANKPQHDTLTNDRTREIILAPVTKELIENSDLIISKYSYDLSRVEPNTQAIKYKMGDTYLQKGENRSFYCWFKPSDNLPINNNGFYDINLINNYNQTHNKGFKVDYKGEIGEIVLTINDKEYSLDVNLAKDTWYCYMFNLNQRQEYVSQYVFKRFSEDNYTVGRLDTSELKLVAKNEDFHIPIEYEFDNINLQVMASPIKLTNLRLFRDIIPKDKFTKILNQNIIKDSEYLIMADNANEKVFLPRYPYN